MLHKIKSDVVFGCSILALLMAGSAYAQEALPQVSQWPQRLESLSGVLTVYQPQPEKFDGNMLTARAAVSLTPPGAAEPEFGALWFHARVSTDRDARLVMIQNIEVRQVKLPNSTDDQDKQFGGIIQQQIPGMNIVLSLDQLENTLGVAQKIKEESQQLQNTPPKIILAQAPTTLVVLNGPPKMQESGIAGVMTVVNTPFIMLMDLGSKTYYLKAGEVWETATDVTGTWSPVTGTLPAGVSEAGAKLSAAPVAATNAPDAANANPAVAQGQAAGQPAQPAQANPGQIVVSEDPAELIASSGAPTYVPLPPGDLLYMSNTQSDVFMEVASQHFFVLLSGRWFTAPALPGPWSYIASDKLPGAFAQIPQDSPKANVLVSVAGTDAAKDARFDAYIPQTTAVQRNAGAGLNVTYDGDPQFVPVEGTSMTYAKNSPDSVLHVDDQYYCCSQGVWYQSAAATGPWAVATAVPPVIYTMPPSCPLYNCRYVYVYDSTPDTVYTGYLSGYTGSYVYGPTVVYGTGYNYPYWSGRNFYAYPATWGFGAQYDFFAGSWGFGSNYYYDRGWFNNRPSHNRWWGPQGYVGYRDLRAIHERDEARDVRINDRNVTINRINIYNREENVRRNAVRAVNRTEAINSEHTQGIRPETARAEAAHPAYAPAENNVYVGHDGGVYRRTEAGWESRTAQGWKATNGVPEAEVEKQAAEDEHRAVDAEHRAVDAEHRAVDAEHRAAENHQAAQPGQPGANARQNETPSVVNPARENSGLNNNAVRENPVRQTPVQQDPIRNAPVRATPADQPHEQQAQPSPARVQQPAGGLEADYAARQRGSSSGNASVQHSANGGGNANSGAGHAGGGGGNAGGGQGHAGGGGGGGKR